MRTLVTASVSAIAVVALAGAALLLAGCSKGLDLRVETRAVEYVGPRLQSPPAVRLRGEVGFDYKVNVSRSFMNEGAAGFMNVVATVSQGERSWERRNVVRPEVGSTTTVDFVFPEPTFNWAGLLGPLLPLILTTPFGSFASAFLDGNGTTAGSCQVEPSPEEMRVRVDCVVQNVGQGSGTVKVVAAIADKDGSEQGREIDIAAEEELMVSFFFPWTSDDERYQCLSQEI